MNTKKCNKCQEVKPVSDFGKESRAKNGYKPRCKKCTNEYHKKMYPNFKTNKLNRQKIYYEENKDQIIERVKTYYHKNRKKIVERNKLYIRARKIKDPYLITLSSFRTLVKKLLKNPHYKTFDYLGYTFCDLLKTLGRLPERTENIDHKVPISWFEDKTELKIIFSLENLQILDALENRKKGARYAHKISKNYYDQIKHFIKPKHLQKINYE
jgi:hypothetical protein